MKLSLAIPTYNRGATLDIQLHDLCSQLSKLNRNDIEIVIQDNCSPDSTSDICKVLIENFPQLKIKYSQNEKNLGFDSNVDLSIQNSVGKYVWVISDDDHLCEGAVQTVIFELDRFEGQFQFAFVNYKISIDNVDSPLKCNLETKIISGENFFSTTKLSSSFITSCIFEKKSWMSLDRLPYIGSMWIHVLATREVLAKGKALIIATPLIIMNKPSLEESRKEKESSKPDGIEFYTYAHITITQFCQGLGLYGYPTLEVKSLDSLCRKEDVNQIINYKLTTKTYSIGECCKTLIAYHSIRGNEFGFYLLLAPLIIAPRSFFKLLRWVKNVCGK